MTTSPSCRTPSATIESRMCCGTTSHRTTESNQTPTGRRPDENAKRRHLRPRSPGGAPRRAAPLVAPTWSSSSGRRDDIRAAEDRQVLLSRRSTRTTLANRQDGPHQRGAQHQLQWPVAGDEVGVGEDGRHHGDGEQRQQARYTARNSPPTVRLSSAGSTLSTAVTGARSRLTRMEMLVSTKPPMVAATVARIW